MNNWLVVIRFKDMVVPKETIQFPPPPTVVPEHPVDAEGMRKLVTAFMEAQDGSIEYEIISVEKES